MLYAGELGNNLRMPKQIHQRLEERLLHCYEACTRKKTGSGISTIRSCAVSLKCLQNAVRGECRITIYNSSFGRRLLLCTRLMCATWLDMLYGRVLYALHDPSQRLVLRDPPRCVPDSLCITIRQLPRFHHSGFAESKACEVKLGENS